ncbi:MAG: hypothetical protein JW395_0113 [Nitrospira sp.]|nr:hypothetical protein [Nitrospira sp.]
MGTLLDLALPCRPLATLPKERGPTETVQGRKTETDRVTEGISEGFHPAQSGGVAPRGRELMAGKGVLSSLKFHGCHKRQEINYAWCVLEAVKRFDGESSLADKLAKKART